MTKRPQLSTDPDAWILGRTSSVGQWDSDAARFVNVRPAKRRAAPEATIQRAIIDRLRLCGVLCVHVPNAGKRSAVAGRRLKSEGMRPGWPDLICVQDGRVAFLEVKAPRGRLSPAQVETHAELARQGSAVAVVTSQDEACEALRERGFKV